MRKTLMILVAVVFFSVSFVHEAFAGPCEQDVEDIPGFLALEFEPDAVGNHGFDYDVTGLVGWPLTVRAYWQSDTYPGWHLFATYLNQPSQFIWLISGTDDNVRYRITFNTNGPYAEVDWLFCLDW